MKTKEAETPKDDYDEVWVILRGGEVINAMKTRQDAVHWFKECLKQTLKDFSKQDKTDEYDYEVNIPALSIKRIKKRSSDLAL